MAYDANYYKRKKAKLLREIANIKADNRRISGDLSRYKTAYNRLKDLKESNAKELKSEMKSKNLGSGLSWRAKSKDRFDDYVDDDLKRSARDYYRQVDDMLDTLSNAIARKESQINTGSRALNSLNSAKAWVEAKLRNLG